MKHSWYQAFQIRNAQGIAVCPNLCCCQGRDLCNHLVIKGSRFRDHMGDQQLKADSLERLENRQSWLDWENTEAINNTSE